MRESRPRHGMSWPIVLLVLITFIVAVAEPAGLSLPAETVVGAVLLLALTQLR